ncbi:filamentous hemagglutinin N-terminal domain-containing protein [Candidatus Albibeggiatoa sp. nov. BB20]|uniref:two-partner secretion domain-containing protein n=1 Tax=Candidatus Albibeggiatoa sp. nov. BB20 TaxID=3162723 RepID=UPI00336548A2
MCLMNIAQADISINNKPLSINNESIFNITQDLGQAVGNNLFHSFDNFNLDAGETAQFSGLGHIQNVISRVIGGEPSFINGTIRSTIPSADFYFLNPYGMVFGEFADVDILGSFHASTADYLKLSDSGEFHARFPERDILSVAPVEAFGFLSDIPASIQLNKSVLITPKYSTLSLIGGELNFQSVGIVGQIADINLISIGGQGEFSLNTNTQAPPFGNMQANDLVIYSDEGGRLNIQANTLQLDNFTLRAIARSQTGRGIYISAEQITLNNGEIFANTDSRFSADTIQLKATKTLSLYEMDLQAVTFGEMSQASAAGRIILDAPSIKLDNTSLNVSTYGAGQGGYIGLNAEQQLILTETSTNGNSSLNASTNSQNPNAGQGGTISINAENMLVDQGTFIVNTSAGIGDGGLIEIQAHELTLSGKASLNNPTGIFATTKYKDDNAGNSGKITIQADNISITNGAEINSISKGQGHSQNIDIVTNTLTIQGGSVDLSTGIFANTESETINSGNGGDISIQAQDVTLLNGGQISSFSNGGGLSGNISIDASQLNLTGYSIVNTNLGEQTIISSISSSSGSSAGNAGQINLNVEEITMNEAGGISSASSGGGSGGNINIDALSLYMDKNSFISSNADGLKGINIGNAGNIQIQADDVELHSQAQILSASKGLGDAGNINVIADNILLQDFSTGIFTSSSNTEQGGNAGEITIEANQLSLLNGSGIDALTWNGGQGGAINLNISKKLLIDGFDTGILSSTLNLEQGGNAGNITIRSPNITLQNKAQINSLTQGSGQGGKIRIYADDFTINHNQMGISGRITAIYSDSLSSASIAGNAGNIFLEVARLHVVGGAQISSETNNSAGGNIQISSLNLIHIAQSQITTSVKGGSGDGGNITFSNPQFTVLNQTQITAQAEVGRGGNIRIIANQFIQSPNNFISASSRLGIDGSIEIISPDETVSNSLLSLENSFFKPIKIRDMCKEAIANQLPTEFQVPLSFKANIFKRPNDFMGDWIPSEAYKLMSCY